MIINGKTYPLEIRDHKHRDITAFINTTEYDDSHGYELLFQDKKSGTTTTDNIKVNYNNAKKWQHLPREDKRQAAFVLLQMGYAEPLNYFNEKYMKG